MKKIIAFLLALTVLFTFSSCLSTEQFDNGEEETYATVPSGSTVKTEDEHYSTVLILGKNSRTKFDTKAISSLSEIIGKSYYYDISESYKASLNLSVIVPDGYPTFVEFPANVMEWMSVTKAQSEDTIKEDIELNLEKLIPYLASEEIKADDDQVDLLAALTRAKAKFAEPGFVSGNSTRLVVIYSSGFGTAGGFDMTKIDVDELSKEAVLDAIPEETFPVFPDGTKCLFIGLGNVGVGQEDKFADNIFTKKMEDIWTEIIEDKCNLELISPIAYSTSGGIDLGFEEGYRDYPYVSPISLEPNKIDVPLGETEGVLFIGDTDAFIDEESTIRFILKETKGLRLKAKADDSVKIYVVGSISVPDGQPDYQGAPDEPLSRDRAERVKEILSSRVIKYKDASGYTGEEYPEENDCVVSPDQIVVINGGLTEFSWRNFSYEERYRNRVVAVTYKGSEDCGDFYTELLENKLVND